MGRGKIIAFLNQKGGVGKTTMAFNTAFALKNQGHSVLCIDMDPQGNLGVLFSIEELQKSRYERGNENDDDDHLHIFHLLINSVKELKTLHLPLLLSDVIVQKNGIDFIPSGQELSGFELSVAGISSPRQMILKKFLDKNGLLNMYDYIIIDSPPTLGLLVVNILCASDGVLVPFRPDEFSRKGLGHLEQVLEEIAEMDISGVPRVLAYIPNLIDSRRKQEEEDLMAIKSEISEGMQGKKFVTPFLNKVQLVKSQALKKSVYDFSGKEYLPLRNQFDEIATLIKGVEW
jgi:chromosome partitioning protein